MTNFSTDTTRNTTAIAHSSLYGANQSYRDLSKRLLDIVLAVLMLPALLPVIAVLYCAVRLEGGPGFFGHERVGQNGQLFKCWKIRTMVPDAKARLEHLLATDPDARIEWERDQKLRNDPRVTNFGSFLRRSSLDELPQIWNVLKGEMSLIGPRPVTKPELERYAEHRWIYLALRPGITGLWQVSGRNDLTYEERVQLDAVYYGSLSPREDAKILWRTVKSVLLRTGY
ncbi:sugar transferase [Alloyangia pacifica]|uniref:Sugar transferase involved in LPS biosynthesis (Colanic, teichoic acid) n=1 Tax=Alloyangia pacifica TaxID=311180 RepID=A0A1I6T4A7_9RHOB|nr:sugar transferase [Alloyangia pacifica]SDG96383.1 Sugar transferase involved in LPS biosynthesis (colanic, teichoic acid) [Alloyangia pacifica]SFS83797.1 Sugar transferase involved in LPS biosynthesis (colanic, teichoic acid) [Alloyangia pacifica]